jgi:HEPN domain-containing protein
MAIPRFPEVRRFYQVALQRFEDAEILCRNGRNTGGIYLAGYAVECILKALLLASVAAPRHRALVKTFSGSKAHDFEWLKQELGKRHVQIPADTARRLASVNTWSTDLRYVAGSKRSAEAQAFLAAAAEIIEWVKGRF